MSFFKIALLTLLLMSFSKIGLADSHEEPLPLNDPFAGDDGKVGTKVNHVMRHTVGLYHGQPGSKDWKRYLSDNMMARDSDFQKAKHIMTIVQNNEKANQINT